MPGAAIFMRWIDVLAALVVGWREQWRARQVLTVAHEKEGLVFRQHKSGGNVVLAFVQAGAGIPEAVIKAGREALVVLELPAEKVLRERLSLPRQAREFLPGIVRNQIERLSPWKADQAVYGFVAEEAPADGAALDVAVSITSRGVVDAARDEIAAAGLVVDRVVAKGGGEPARSMTLWSRVADAPGETLRRTRMWIAAGMTACVALSLGASAWALASASAMQSETEELASRTRSLQRRVQDTRGAASKAMPSALGRAWSAKEAAPSAVITLEALSRGLPETAYLTDLNMEGSTLRITGLTGYAPSLIAPLEASGHFADVRFFAPTTRNVDGARFRFYIEARIQPRLQVASQ